MSNSKLLFILIVTCAIFFGFSGITAQNKATILVRCSDYDGNPRQGEQVWFVAKGTNDVFKGISDGTGQFKVDLPGPETYTIQLKSVGEAFDYTEMTVPALEPGQSYGQFEVDVKIRPPRDFTLDHVHFKTGSADLESGSFPELNELYELMRLQETLVIEIGGHTDNVGADDDNLDLSQRRAETVRNHLIGKGISADRIKAKGYGESKPVADNEMAEGRKLNRRTAVIILSE